MQKNIERLVLNVPSENLKKNLYDTLVLEMYKLSSNTADCSP